MKISLDAQVLAEAVAWTARTVPQRPSVPVLSGLVIDAAEDQLTLSAFDYDVSTRCQASADVAEPGRVLLPARILVEVTKALPARRVAELALSGSEVVLSCGSAEFGLLTLPVGDYPTLPEPPAAAGTVDAAVFRRAVEQVYPAASRDDSLPMITGIRFEATPDGLTLAATDRYVLATRTIPWQPAMGAADLAAMVPAEALHNLARTLGSGELAFGFTDSLAGFTSAGRTTTVRLLDPQFIDFRVRLFGLDMPVQAVVDTAMLTAAVKLVSLVAERNTAVRLSFDGQEVLVQAGAGDTGRGTETLPAQLEGADSFQVAFQPQFLLHSLAGVDAGQVRLHMTKPAAPVLFAGEGEDDSAFRCLTMALRLA